MRITENTETRLVIEHQPWLFAGALWATAGATALAAFRGEAIGAGLRGPVAALALGLGALAWWATPFRRITFDRAAGTVERRTHRPFRRRAETLPLAGVARACQQAEHSDGARLTRLALEVEGRVVPLDHAFGPGDLDGIEAAINAWLGTARR